MKIRHLICIILIFAMIPLQSFANDISQSEDSACYTVLKQLEIIPPNISERYAPSKGITRGEFVQLVARCMGSDTNPLLQSSVHFEDVGEDDAYYNEVNYCATLGLINGNGNGKFNPESKISVNEATKIIITALGYHHLAEYGGGYPFGYISQANKLDILKSISSVGDKNITMSEAFAIIYKAVNTPLLEQSTYGSGSVGYTNESGKTLLSVYRRIYRYEGVIQGVHTLTFENIDGIRENEVLINNVVYKTKIDCLPFAGVMSEYYYNENTKTVDAVIPLTDNSDVQIINGNDIVSFERNILVYESGGKEEKAVLSKSVKTAYNGRPLTTLTKDDFLNVDGTVKLIDNDNDGSADYVILSSVENYVIKSVNVNKQTIYDMYDTKKSFCVQDVEYFVFKNELGDKISFDELVAYDVVSVYLSKDQKFAEMILSNSEVIGKAEEVSVLAEDFEVTVSGKKYSVSKNFADPSAKIKPGAAGVFLLDVYGRIVAFRQEADMINWGYMIATVKSESLDYGVKSKILTQNGSVEVFELSDKIVLDGKAVDSIEAYEILKSDTDGQIVRYKTESGVIKNIDTLTKSENENDIYLNVLHQCYNSDKEKTSDLRWSYSQNILGGKLPVTSKTPVFCIPFDMKDEDSYKVVYRSYFSDGSSYPVDAYRSDEYSHFAEALVMYGNFGASQISKYSKVMLVEGITDALDENGEHVYKLSGLHNNKKVSYFITKQEIIDNLKSNKTPSQTHALNCGDVIKVAVNTETNEVERIVLYYEKDIDYLHQPTAAGTNVYGENRMMKVNVYSNDSDNLWLTQNPLDSENIVLTTNDIESVNLSAYQLYKYSIGRDSKPECSVAGAEDIIDYKSSSEEFTKAIMFSMYTDSGTIIIYDD